MWAWKPISIAHPSLFGAGSNVLSGRPHVHGVFVDFITLYVLDSHQLILVAV